MWQLQGYLQNTRQHFKLVFSSLCPSYDSQRDSKKKDGDRLTENSQYQVPPNSYGRTIQIENSFGMEFKSGSHIFSDQTAGGAIKKWTYVPNLRTRLLPSTYRLSSVQPTVFPTQRLQELQQVYT